MSTPWASPVTMAVFALMSARAHQYARDVGQTVPVARDAELAAAKVGGVLQPSSRGGVDADGAQLLNPAAGSDAAAAGNVAPYPVTLAPGFAFERFKAALTEGAYLSEALAAATRDARAQPELDAVERKLAAYFPGLSPWEMRVAAQRAAEVELLSLLATKPAAFGVFLDQWQAAGEALPAHLRPKGPAAARLAAEARVRQFFGLSSGAGRQPKRGTMISKGVAYSKPVAAKVRGALLGPKFGNVQTRDVVISGATEKASLMGLAVVGAVAAFFAVRSLAKGLR